MNRETRRHRLHRLAVTFLLACLALTTNAAADIAVVADRSLPLSKLSRQQVADAYLGKSHHIGTLEIEVVDQLPDSAIRDEFYRKVAGKTQRELKAYRAKRMFRGRGSPPQVVESDEQVKLWLTQHPRGIGYIDSASVDDSLRVLLTVK